VRGGDRGLRSARGLAAALVSSRGKPKREKWCGIFLSLDSREFRCGEANFTDSGPSPVATSKLKTLRIKGLICNTYYAIK
jgi:hypothetical protein